MALTIFPSNNDVAAVAGGGISLQEQAFATLLKALIGQNFVIHGYSMPTSSPTLTVSVAGGGAIIDGRHVLIQTSTPVTCQANQTNYIWLRILKDVGGNVDGAVIEATLSPSISENKVGLGIATAGASSISSIVDTRFLTGTKNHNHTSATSNGQGGLLGSNTVGLGQVKVTAQSALSGSHSSSSAPLSFEFTVTGTRIGDFTITPSNADGGSCTLMQVHPAATAAGSQRWRLNAAADGPGGSTQYTISWNILATVS